MHKDPVKFLILSVFITLLMILNISCQRHITAPPKSQEPLGFKLFIGPKDCPRIDYFPDPYVFKVGQEWYITSTSKYMFKTSNWSDKTRYELDLDMNQDYLRSYFSMPSLKIRGFWGFTPYQHTDGKWHAYATINAGNFKTFICHFSPRTDQWPITRWKLDKILIGDPTTAVYESKIYSPDEKNMYMVYTQNLSDGHNHIMTCKMLDPETLDPSFTPRPILSPEGLRSEDRNPPGGMQLVEGPSINFVDGKYIMLYTVGDFARLNYKLGFAYSDVMIPPAGKQYSKPKVPDTENIWGNSLPADEVYYLLQTQKDKWFNYLGSRLDGPGVGNLLNYEGRYYIVFHARYPDPENTYETGKNWGGSHRWVWICPVEIDFTKPAMQWIQPVLSDTQ